LRDERRWCVRRNRVVLTHQCWRQVPKKLALPGGDGGTAWPPGRSRISRKAIAQGRPDCFRFTCMLMCAFFDAHLHMRPRVQRAPGLPCALCLRREQTNLKTSGKLMSRERRRTSHRRPGLEPDPYSASDHILHLIDNATGCDGVDGPLRHRVVPE
jgi:hypothetical protein